MPEETLTFRDVMIGIVVIILIGLVGLGIGYKIWGNQVKIVYPSQPNIVEEYTMSDGSLKIENDGREIVFYTKVNQIYNWDGRRTDVPAFERKDVYKVQDGKIVFDKKYKGIEKKREWVEWVEF